MKIKVRKTLTGWAPADEEGEKYHKKYKLGDIYSLDMSRFRDQRTVELNGLYWSVLRIVIVNQEEFISTKQLHFYIKKVLGIVEEIYNPKSKKMEEVVGSTSFDSMKNEEFKDYFKDSIELIKRYVIPGVTEYDLIEAACNRGPLMPDNQQWINENYRKC